jgi:molybdopterin-guanine dinucleotide biosynthesis protein A
LIAHSQTLDHALDQTLGVVLAGGQSRRMGFDKSFAELQGRPMIAHVIGRLRSQTGALAINAQRPFGRFAAFGAPVFDDAEFAGHGPASGLCAALKWAREQGRFQWIATAPTDMPFIPVDMAPRLLTALIERGGMVSAATHGPDIQPALAVWSVASFERVAHLVQVQGTYALCAIQRALTAHSVCFQNEPEHSFINVNYPPDLMARTMVKGGRSGAGMHSLL